MRVLITGGAGFIGTNLAAACAAAGEEVTVLDDLSRPGVEQNAAWLQRSFPGLQLVRGDVADPDLLARLCPGADRVFHLAAQVAVTTSLEDPLADCRVNLLGTLHLLEAVRRHAPEALLFFTSTNKVYGGLEDLEVVRDGDRYRFAALDTGVPESRPLDFHSPYGCSKGAADQYVRDYARVFGLRTVVFRMSCIYGPHQCGNEDQGWVAHFARRALDGAGLTLYGDGRQVRDVLFAEDLVRAFRAAAEQPERVCGEVFNIGGGPGNTVSLLELIALLREETGREIPVSFAPWRPGDQRVYVTDVRRAADRFGWAPRVGVREGVRRLLDWLRGRPQVPSAATAA